MDQTVSGYHILGWKTDVDGTTYAWIMGREWCRYSAKLSAILIDEDWHTY